MMRELEQAERNEQAAACSKLWSAVLLRGVRDATCPDGDSRMHRTGARRWLMGKSEGLEQVSRMHGYTVNRAIEFGTNIIKRIDELPEGTITNAVTWKAWMRMEYPELVGDSL